MRITEKLAHNVGALRKVVSLKTMSCPLPLLPLRQCGERSDALSSGTPTLQRKILTDLIFDEEKANVDYRQLAANPVFSDFQRQLILGIADDEQRHHAILQGIFNALEDEGRIVGR